MLFANAHFKICKLFVHVRCSVDRSRGLLKRDSNEKRKERHQFIKIIYDKATKETPQKKHYERNTTK